MNSQIEIQALIVHEPLMPVRNLIGEQVYAEKWRAMMASMPRGWNARDEEEHHTVETAMLREVLQWLGGEIGQREASVCASFVVWLGTSVGLSLLRRAKAWRHLHGDDAILVAWTLSNQRAYHVNHGHRSIEIILAEPAHFKKGRNWLGEDFLIEVPPLSARDAETIEQLCSWLGGEGVGFLMDCESEIDRREKFESYMRNRAANGHTGAAA